MSLLFDSGSSKIVENALIYTAKTNENIYKLKNYNVLVAKNNRKFGILCGGGAGHEPFAAGFVGKGGLDCAVSGEIFTSPSVKSIYAGLQALIELEGKTEILVMIINYTGDRINFGQAVEQAKVNYPEVKIDMFSVADDKSLEESQARGLTAALICIKMAKGMFESGLALEQVMTELNLLNFGTVGCSVSTCSSITSPKKHFEGFMELGLGIHGEPGCEQIELPKNGKLEFMVEKTLDLLCKKMVLFDKMDKIVIVNNLGGFSNLEMLNVCEIVLEKLGTDAVMRIGTGALMTSLDMKGFNISVCEVQKMEQLAWFDYEHKISCWPIFSNPNKIDRNPYDGNSYDRNLLVEVTEKKINKNLKVSQKVGKYLKVIAETLIAIEADANELDSICADGDCGSTFARLGKAISDNLEIDEKDDSNFTASEFLKCVHWFSDACGEYMGGSSGGLLSIGLNRVITSLKTDSSKTVDAVFLASFFEILAQTIKTYGGADKGQKTLLDIFFPLADGLKSFSGNSGTVGQFLADLCEESTEKTKKMIPLAGRAAYAGRISDTVDPGCYVISVVLKKMFPSE